MLVLRAWPHHIGAAALLTSHIGACCTRGAWFSTDELAHRWNPFAVRSESGSPNLVSTFARFTLVRTVSMDSSPLDRRNRARKFCRIFLASCSLLCHAMTALDFTGVDRPAELRGFPLAAGARCRRWCRVGICLELECEGSRSPVWGEIGVRGKDWEQGRPRCQEVSPFIKIVGCLRKTGNKTGERRSCSVGPREH